MAMCKSAYSLAVPQPSRGPRGDKASLHSTVLCTNMATLLPRAPPRILLRAVIDPIAQLSPVLFLHLGSHRHNTKTEAGNATLIGVAFHHTLPLSSRHIQYIASQGRTTPPPYASSHSALPACLSVCLPVCADGNVAAPLSSSCNQIAHLSLIGQLPRYSSYHLSCSFPCRVTNASFCFFPIHRLSTGMWENKILHGRPCPPFPLVPNIPRSGTVQSYFTRKTSPQTPLLFNDDDDGDGGDDDEGDDY